MSAMFNLSKPQEEIIVICSINNYRKVYPKRLHPLIKYFSLLGGSREQEYMPYLFTFFFFYILKYLHTVVLHQ